MTPPKGGYTTPTPALDLTTSLRGDWYFTKGSVTGAPLPDPPPLLRGAPTTPPPAQANFPLAKEDGSDLMLVRRLGLRDTHFFFLGYTRVTRFGEFGDGWDTRRSRHTLMAVQRQGRAHACLQRCLLHLCSDQTAWHSGVAACPADDDGGQPVLSSQDFISLQRFRVHAPKPTVVCRRSHGRGSLLPEPPQRMQLQNRGTV